MNSEFGMLNAEGKNKNISSIFSLFRIHFVENEIKYLQAAIE